MNSLHLGLQLMGYGLAGVFTVLIAFIVLIKALTSLFPTRDAAPPEEQ